MITLLLLGICDDLPSDRLQIEKYIKDYCIKEDTDINFLTFENGETLVKYYVDDNAAFDIIFLDIYMGGKNGIKTAEQIRKYDSDCKIIFITSSTEHALESFEVFPFNYLIKPISKNIFDHVFEKAIKIIAKEKQKSLSIKIGSTIQTVFYKDILFIDSNAKILNIHTSKNQILSSHLKLDDIEKEIDDNRFIRCHQSFLVNMDYILSVEDYSFKLTDITQVPVTQRYFAKIKKTFYDYILDRANFHNNLDKVD